MSDELMTVKPFAFYVLEEEPVPAINQPPTGVYNPGLQIWVYGQESTTYPIEARCDGGHTNTDGHVTTYKPKNPGWDVNMDYSDSD